MFETLAGAEDDAAEGWPRRGRREMWARRRALAVAASGTTPHRRRRETPRRWALSFLPLSITRRRRWPPPPNVIFSIRDRKSSPDRPAWCRHGAKGGAQSPLDIAHIKLGAVHDGMMVNVKADNLKLKKRARGIVSRITGAGEDKAAAALEATRGDVKPAVLICAGAKSPAAAQNLLTAARGNLRQALARLAASS
jgi:N-acetylmuramic acid 6-phosphate (MurNAc-6-P) etherase